MDAQKALSLPITDAHRHSLRSKVAHAAEILHAQGPISTFIHTNPLHSLEHLSFEEAIHRAQLLFGIESLTPSELRWQVHREKATRRFRPDVPPEKRTFILQKAATELRLSLDRIGREWTLAEWVQAHTNLDVVGNLREGLCRELRREYDGESLRLTPRRAAVDDLRRWLGRLEIPQDRHHSYLKCIDRQLFNMGIYATARRDGLAAHWLEAEAALLHRLVPRHLDCRGTFKAISRRFEEDLEAYAILSLWNAVLAGRGLDDPLSLSNPQRLYAEDQADRSASSTYEAVSTVERDGGLAVPLTADLKAAIELEVKHVALRRERRRAILALIDTRGESDELHALPPLTLTLEARSVFDRKPRGVSYSSALLRLLGELQLRKGFGWTLWDEMLAEPLLISIRPIDDAPWRQVLRDGLRLRLSDEMRAALTEKYGTPRHDSAAEHRRNTILSGLLEDGLTHDACEALREDIPHWDDEGDSAIDTVAEELLCRRVLEGLRPAELTRAGFMALEQLVDLRGRTSARRRLIADLRKLDPREHMIKTAHKILADKMASLGHDLALSDFLRRLTGQDLTSRVNHYMIKWCAAFLDEGIAAWPMPGRERGFYAAWKALASCDWDLAFASLRAWGEAVRGLPDRPEDALIRTLHGLGIPEEHWADYLARRLVQLPGWAGLIKWREHRPHYSRQEREHIDLVEYLAVRLFCESLLIKHVCRAVWNLDGTAHSLHHLFRDHPSEFMVRRELSLGGLPDYLSRRARALVRRNPQGEDRQEWVLLAQMIWVARQAESPGHSPIHTVCRNAWRLFHLAQFLGWTGADVRSLSVEEGDRRLATLDSFPAPAHRPVWLHAYEHHYQADVLKCLADNRRQIRVMEERPRVQLVLCIDEREESMRRHIEAQDPAYETLGTAGFFGVAMNYSRLGEKKVTPLCPVVVIPAHHVWEIAGPDQGDTLRRASKRNSYLKYFDKLFLTLKKDPIVSYFLIDVTAALLGVILLGKTVFPRRFERFLKTLHHTLVPPVRTTLQLEAPADQPDPQPIGPRLGYTADEQAGVVEGQLRVIGLIKRFARLVLFIGHGSTSQNNPHESAHDCGACGGKHGAPMVGL